MYIPKIVKASGRCYYFDEGEIDIHNFDTDEHYVDQCEISDFSVTSTDGSQTARVKCDTGDSKEYAGGIVSGFFYDNGKFSGKVSYPQDKDINEQWTGNWVVKNDGLHIKGEIYVNSESVMGFYMVILTSNLKTTTPESKPKNKTSLGLDYTFHRKLIKLSETFNTGTKNSYYPKAISLKLKPSTDTNLYIAMCIAYSWMPTMLDIYTDGNQSLKAYVPVVSRFSKLKTLKDLEINEVKIKSDLVKLAKLVNNSIVGASKMLHLFFPHTVPIIDSRVLIGWNHFFVTHYINYPQLKLPDSFPGRIENQVELYFRYWKILMDWNESIKGTSIREIEEAFYWIGKNNIK